MLPRLSSKRWLITIALQLLSCQDVANGDASSPPTDDGSNLRLELPRSHVAFGGDVHATLFGASDATLPPFSRIRLSRQDGSHVTSVATIPLLPDPTQSHLVGANATRFTVPCGYFTKGGPYYIDILTNANTSDFQNENLSKTLDVRWPVPKISITPERVETYPDLPVTVLLEFPEAVCEGPPSGTSAAPPADFSLELLYCGHSERGSVLCDGNNATSPAQVLTSEQIHGFPGRRTVTLRCELFGMAGDYALILRPSSPSGSVPSLDYSSTYIKADWSSQFVLNVHARSVFPCGGSTGGVRALFQYPACILERADRVRVFGRVRAAVASLAPPTTLHYVAEQRVVRGQHAVTFDCELFSERFVEYCFVYVSQALSGAVTDVRMDCVPTMPVSEGDAGGWGPWSAWSACPANEGAASCAGSTRSRHRFCDSPPPRYGAKFCEGESVETSTCTDASECIRLTGSRIATGVADTPEVVAEIGPGCRCGCVVHVSAARTARLVAGSTRACPGRSFWLIQADIGQAVRMTSLHVALPCAAQRLRARDGDSLAANMLAQWIGGVKEKVSTQSPTDGDVVTIDRFLLLELFSDELAAGSDSCAGGFIAHAQQIVRNATAARSAGVTALSSPAAGGRRGASAAVAALAVAAGAAFAAVALAIHSAVRTRHYYRRARANDKDELTDSDACSASMIWLQNAEAPEGDAGATRGSRSTLLSEIVEVVSLRKLRRAHTRLRESKNIDEEICVDVHNHSDDYASDASSITLHNAPIPGVSGHEDDQGIKDKPVSAPETPVNGPTPSPLRRSKTASEETGEGGTLKRDKRQPSPSNLIPSGASEPSTVAIDLSASMSSVTDKELDSVSEREIDSVGDKDSAKEKGTLMAHSRTSSAATLTNGCYSPALSAISTAKVRLNNSKETKEQKNRRKLLHGGGPGSEFSISTQEELELDYYDYEVNNAGAAPGSYLGMDPAFLVWIPPFDEIGEEGLYDKDHHLYEEILPKDDNMDPGSNTESPENDAPPLPEPRSLDTNLNNKKEPSKLDKLLKSTIIHPLNFSSSDLGPENRESPNFDRKFLNQRRDSIDRSAICIPMVELPNNKVENSPARVRQNSSEKIYKVTSASGSFNHLVDVTDIQFADEDSDTSNELKSSPTDGVGNIILKSNKF